MAGYWLGSVTPEEQKPHFFFEERLIGYPAFQKRISELDELNLDNHQILLLFVGESDKLVELEDGTFHPSRVWHQECQILEDVVDLLKPQCQPTGWLIHVGVGSLEEWKEHNNPFKKDPRLRILKLPTLFAWNTLKKVSGRHALKIPNIMVMLDDWGSPRLYLPLQPHNFESESKLIVEYLRAQIRTHRKVVRVRDE